MSGTIITLNGRSLLNKLERSGAALKITRVGIGNGILNSSDNPAEQTDLICHKMNIPVIRIEKMNDEAVIGGQIYPQIVSEKMRIYEAGIFAEDPDLGEILYAYLNLSGSGQTMTNQADMVARFIEITFVIKVGAIKTIIGEISPSGYLSSEYFGEVMQQYIGVEDIGSPHGVAGLDAYGKIPVSQFPDGLIDDLEGIYGVEVDYQEQTIIRLGAAAGKTGGRDFDRIGPWDRKRCMVTSDGAVLAYYGEPDYTESGFLNTEIEKNGKTYHLGTRVNIMVEQPVFWIKVVPLEFEHAASGRGWQLKKVRYLISPDPRPGYHINDVFKDDDGILQDKIYLSAYEGIFYDSSLKQFFHDHQIKKDIDFDDDRYELAAIAGYQPVSGLKINLTRDNARKLAVRVGTGWKLNTFFAMAVTQMLALIEYATFDTQAALGNGYTYFYYPDIRNYSANTGATAGLGNQSSVGTGGWGKSSITYRGEENVYGNMATWLDGINVRNGGVNNVYLKANGELRDGEYKSYCESGIKLPGEGGFPEAFGYSQKFDYLFLPALAPAYPEEGRQRFVKDQLYISEEISESSKPKFTGVVGGGRWHDYDYAGLWNMHISEYKALYTTGARLLYVPQTIDHE